MIAAMDALLVVLLALVVLNILAQRFGADSHASGGWTDSTLWEASLPDAAQSRRGGGAGRRR